MNNFDENDLPGMTASTKLELAILDFFNETVHTGEEGEDQTTFTLDSAVMSICGRTMGDNGESKWVYLSYKTPGTPPHAVVGLHQRVIDFDYAETATHNMYDMLYSVAEEEDDFDDDE